jgi:hypothetical protein
VTASRSSSQAELAAAPAAVWRLRGTLHSCSCSSMYLPASKPAGCTHVSDWLTQGLLQGGTCVVAALLDPDGRIGCSPRRRVCSCLAGVLMILRGIGCWRWLSAVQLYLPRTRKQQKFQKQLPCSIHSESALQHNKYRAMLHALGSLYCLIRGWVVQPTCRGVNHEPCLQCSCRILVLRKQCTLYASAPAPMCLACCFEALWFQRP